MVNIYSQSGHTRYGVKEYICDTNEDIDLLPLDDTPGSSALVIDSGALYILNSSHEWKKQGGEATATSVDTTEYETRIQELEEQVAALTTANNELTQKVADLEAVIAE